MDLLSLSLSLSLSYFVCLQNLSDNPTIANNSDKECEVMTL
jgi:hypothetical protein